MTRLFVDDEIKLEELYTLDSENSHYISSVLRMRIGEELVIVDSSFEEVIVSIEQITKKEVILKPISRQKCTSEPRLKITLFQAVSKGERMDATIQKSVELGVTTIVPVLSERCVVRLDSKDSSGKVDRWQKIALEAARQSGRGIVPKISNPISYKQAIEDAGKLDMTLFLWEDEHSCSIKQALEDTSKNQTSVGVVIGPEGGFSQEEADQAVSGGCKRVTVGPRILRTETAGPAAIAMIMYSFEL